MLIEYPDPHERKRELARLIGVEDRMFVEVEGHARVYAIADEDLDRENDEKTSSVHFLRFEFRRPARDAVRAGAAVKLGCDHTNYPAHVDDRRRRRWPAWPATCADANRYRRVRHIQLDMLLVDSLNFVPVAPLLALQPQTGTSA